MELKELQERQGWSLSKKIDHSLFTIETFLSRTDGQAYVAFSGGKDSTCLLDLVRIIDKSIPAVFVNTGNEWLDIIRFVHHLRDEKGYNIIELHPKFTPREVWEKYGFPLVTKAQAEYIHLWRKNPSWAATRQERSESKGWSFGRVADRWKWLVEESFDTSNLCCKHLKKDPSRRYEKQTGRHPILGTMASESDLRRTEYLNRGGCNTFGGRRGVGFRSTPLAIWMDEDIWGYIRERDLEICDIYRKGVKRTGCVGCGFGCFNPGDPRFKMLYQLYPKVYAMVMNYTNNGTPYREALRKVMAVTGQELPDESGEIFFPIE